jgi:hypothetical protein
VCEEPQDDTLNYLGLLAWDCEKLAVVKNERLPA